MKTYNTTAKDVKEFATLVDESRNRANHREYEVQHLLWVTDELVKSLYYMAKRVDDLSGDNSQPDTKEVV
jgi:hypothetical protein